MLDARSKLDLSTCVFLKGTDFEGAAFFLKAFVAFISAS